LKLRIERWAKQQKEKPSRSEAIRHLLESALEATPQAGSAGEKAAAKASDKSGSAFGQLANPPQPPDKQAKRKRRRVKGPSEFREMREDLPKRKR
jgi:protein subunit release factor B